MLVDRWNKLAGTQRICEIDVWTEFQDLTRDIISRAAFGSSYEEGRKILKLQKELQVLVMEAMQTVYIPGLRGRLVRFEETEWNPETETRRKERNDPELFYLFGFVAETE
ncbi:hypothetical protein DCAR_0830857 [Daucus carota subsp. sativus]|uniref:Uncharacterized protein n=1 Tax=Daucus carota subsp. sativus TaxID=79200 RepID=A0A175YMR8_DAUCS|nr:hypothetical protein DCAR_0830857 [Daucus carota subsp. sativus]